jgi:fibronectin-binding autotransporter adhesin
MKIGAAIRIAAVVAVWYPAFALAGDDVWNAAQNGDWTDAVRWTDGGAPNAADTATFDKIGTYSVVFGSTPSEIQNLTVQAGDVTFISDGTARHTLNVNAAGGAQNLIVSGATTKLTFGAYGSLRNLPIKLVLGDSLSVQDGASLDLLAGSYLVAKRIDAAGINGTVRLESDASGLALEESGPMAIGTAGGTGSFTLQYGATTSNLPVQLSLADDLFPNSNGTLSVTYDAKMSVRGAIRLATQNQTGQAATLKMYGAGATLTQTEPNPVVVGSTTNGTAQIEIGVDATGATFTTGGGEITINKTGAISIGSDGSTNVGIFNANGDISIKGGILTRSRSSLFKLGEGRTMTLQDGGRALFGGSYLTAKDAQYNLTGASRFELSSGSGPSFDNFTISNDASLLVASGSKLISAGRVDVGPSGDGTLVVDGDGSSVTGDNWALNSWGRNSGVADVVFQNGATGSFGALRLASSTGGGTRATVNVESGASVNVGSLSIATDGGQTIAGTLSVQGNNSRVTQASTGATTLTLGLNFTGSATLNIGTTDSGAVFTTGTGAITIDKTGTLRVGSSSTTGTLNVNGPLTVKNGGLLDIGPGSTANVALSQTISLATGGRLTGGGVVAGSVANTSGVVSPGSSPGVLTVNGNYQQQSSGALQLQIGGLASGTEFDRFVVNGSATLNGILKISLLNGFQPSLGHSFDLLDWQTVSGTFSSVQLPSLAGALQWSTAQLYSTGDLSVVSTLAGDFNQDGGLSNGDIKAMLVALTDVAAYQNQRGLSASQLLAIGDFTSDGRFTNADIQPLLNALANIGGAGSIAGVPEPTSAALAAAGILGTVLLCARRKAVQLAETSQAL